MQQHCQPLVVLEWKAVFAVACAVLAVLVAHAVLPVHKMAVVYVEASMSSAMV